MQKILSMIMAAAVLLSLIPLASAATAVSGWGYAPPYDIYGGSQPSGTRQYYSAVLDGEGEADVAAKLTFQNTQKELIEAVVVEIPGTQLRLLNALQEYTLTENRSGYYPYYRTAYSTLKPQQETLSRSVMYTIPLEQPIKEQETGVVLLRYKSAGIAVKSMGAFSFTFETAKTAYDTDSVRIAINVQDGYHLDNTASAINYRIGFAEAAAFSGKAAESAAVSRFSQSIEYERGLVKHAYSLDPWESFTITGHYAESWLRLHYRGMLASALAFAALAAVAVAGTRTLLRQRNAAVIAVAAGILSALSMAGVTLLTMALLQNSNKWFGYGSSNALVLLIMLLIAALLLALFLLPPAVVGMKYGAAYGIITILVALAALAAVVLLLALFSLQPSRMIAYSTAAIAEQI
jgi:hypothetical protein